MALEDRSADGFRGQTADPQTYLVLAALISVALLFFVWIASDPSPLPVDAPSTTPHNSMRTSAS